jgi:chromosome segregation ATPase
MTELEIEIGKHLNSFKKIFKKYSREVQRGSFSGDFGLVSSAIAYEENPVKQFLNESENNSEIIALLEELLKIGQSNLHLKQKYIINIRKELKIINQGKLNIEKDEWKEILNEKQKEGDSDEFKALNRKLTKAENDLELIKNELNSKKEEISLKEKEITQSNDSLAERRQRTEDLVKDIENDYNR